VSGEKHDLGSGFSYTFTGWEPDRDLNPQYEDLPDIPIVGIIIWRDESALGHCMFDTPEVKKVFPKGPHWTLVSMDPLHIEPSVQMYEFKNGENVPSYHGFIRNGKWENA